MKVTRWRGGNSQYYGIRISLKLKVNGRDARERHFDRSWDRVEVEFANKVVEPHLTGGFWRKCPELRNKELGDWVTLHGDGPLDLKPVHGRRFRLTAD